MHAIFESLRAVPQVASLHSLRPTWQIGIERRPSTILIIEIVSMDARSCGHRDAGTPWLTLHKHT